jgi:hypothetical protein
MEPKSSKSVSLPVPSSCPGRLMATCLEIVLGILAAKTP